MPHKSFSIEAEELCSYLKINHEANHAKLNTKMPDLLRDIETIQKSACRYHDPSS
jgi:hypothetical protein